MKSSDRKGDTTKKNGFRAEPLFDRSQWGTGFPGWGAEGLPGPGLLFGVGKEKEKATKQTDGNASERPAAKNAWAEFEVLEDGFRPSLERCAW